jgi:hypothetical protein
MNSRLFLTALATSLACCGQTAQTGAIHGAITDASGSAIAGAPVEVSSPSRAVKLTTRSDPAGGFRFYNLVPATDYAVSVAAGGFQTWTRAPLAVVSGEPLTIRVQLAVEARRESIEVSAPAPAVAPESTEVSTNVGHERLLAMPTNGRHLNRFALLDARVRNTGGLGGDGSNLTRLSINGSTFRNTQYRLDGQTNYDTLYNNAPLQQLSLSAVQEFRVLTNQFNAEHGSTSVGLVIATTRAGTNQVHGEALFYGRPSGIQARPPLAKMRIPNQLLQEGGSLGGPVRRDKTHYFLNYERTSQERGSYISTVSPGFFIGRYRNDLALARLDHQFSSAHSAALRLNGQRESNTNANDSGGGTVQPSAAVKSAGQSMGAQMTETALWRGLVNELRLGYTNAVPSNSSPLTPGVVVTRSGYSTEGNASYSMVRTEIYQLSDQAIWQRGAHTFKAGGDFIRRKIRDFSFSSHGTYTFPAGAPVAGQQPTQYSQRFGVARLRYGQTQWAGFFQDTWRLSQRLTVNLGVRYDYQSVLDDCNNFGPRLGLSWDPKGDGATILRGAFGLFYDQPFFHGLTQRFLQGGVNAPYVTYTLAPSDPNFPGYPYSYNPLAHPAGLTLAPAAVYVRTGTLLSPYTTQSSIGVERRIPGGWTLSVTGVRNLSVKQFMHINLNAPSSFLRTAAGQSRSVAAADRTRPLYDAALGVSMYQGVPVRDVRLVTNGATNVYHGLDIRLARRVTHRLQVSAHYALTSSMDSITNDHLGSNPQDWNDILKAEWALSDFAQRHRFVGSGVVSLPRDIQVSAFAVLASGLPVNPLTGSDNDGNSGQYDRPAGFGRNSFRGTPQRSFDLSLARPIRLRDRARVEIRGDAFNLFNNQNYYKFNNVYGNGSTPNATFMQPVSGVANVDPGRQFTFGLRLLF